MLLKTINIGTMNVTQNSFIEELILYFFQIQYIDIRNTSIYPTRGVKNNTYVAKYVQHLFYSLKL